MRGSVNTISCPMPLGLETDTMLILRGVIGEAELLVLLLDFLLLCDDDRGCDELAAVVAAVVVLRRECRRA